MKGALVLLYELACCLMLVTGATTGGNSEGNPCYFPFTYDSKLYFTCIYASGSYLWCSTTANYDSDKKWGSCTDTSEAESGVFVMLDGEDQPFTHYIGSIVSHRGYPQNYYFNNVDSTRKMEVAGVLSITLRVIFFQLEPHGMVGECLDFLQIGNDVQLCGTDLQAGDMKTFLEADGELELRFSTNSRSTKTGFRIRYQYSELEPFGCETDRLLRAYQYIQPANNSDGHAMSALCKIRLPSIRDTMYCSSSNNWKMINTGEGHSACFNILVALAIHSPQPNSLEEISDKQGYIISHTNFPDDYTANIDSSLTITGLQPQQIVQIKFLVFDLYYHVDYPGCNHDFLQINGSTQDDEYKLCSYPNNEPTVDRWYSITVYGSRLTFRFITNENPSVKSGFYFQFKVLEPVPEPTTTYVSSSTAEITITTASTKTVTTETTPVTITTQTLAENTTDRSPTNATSTQTVSITGSTNTKDIKSAIAAENPTDSDNQMQRQDNSVALGAGIGVSALVILIVIIMAVLVLVKRRREQSKSKPDEGDSGPTYGYTNRSAETTLQIRMSALIVDSENYYSMSDTAGINNNPVTSQNGTGTSAGETDYDMAEQVDTGGVYHLADDAGTDNSEYTLAEEVTPTRSAESANSQVTGYEDEYQLADYTAEDYANIELFHRAEDESTLEEDYSPVLVTTKTKKRKPDAGVTELVDNELYGS